MLYDVNSTKRSNEAQTIEEELCLYDRKQNTGLMRLEIQNLKGVFAGHPTSKNSFEDDFDKDKSSERAEANLLTS